MKYNTPSPGDAQPEDSSILPANTAHVEIGISTQRGAAVDDTMYDRYSLDTLYLSVTDDIQEPTVSEFR